MKIKQRHALLHPKIVLGVALLLIFGIWHLISLQIGDSPRRVPTTIGVAEVFQNELLKGETDPLLADATSRLSLLSHALITLQHWAIGFGIALLLGLGLGILLGLSNYASKISLPAVNFLRSMPSAALYPALILLVGINLKSKLFVIAFGALWPILLSAEAGIRTLHKETFDALHFMPISRARKLLLHLRWAAPSIFVGIELSCGIAFLLTVTAEMLGSIGGGLGSYIALSLQRYGGVASDRAAAALVLVGVMSYCLISATAAIGNLFNRPQSFRTFSAGSAATSAAHLPETLIPENAEIVYSGPPYMWPAQFKTTKQLYQLDLISTNAKGSRSFHRVWTDTTGKPIGENPSDEQLTSLLCDPSSKAQALFAEEVFEPSLAKSIGGIESQPLLSCWIQYRKDKKIVAIAQVITANRLAEAPRTANDAAIEPTS